MSEAEKENEWRLYGDLAWLWPLWEDISIYEQETELFVELIKKQAKIDDSDLPTFVCLKV